MGIGGERRRPARRFASLGFTLAVVGVGVLATSSLASGGTGLALFGLT